MDQSEGNWFSEDVATFGDRLAAARGAAGMTQGQFARRLGVKLSTVKSWEDDLSEPRANKLQMMAGLLNVSVGWLLIGEGEGVEEVSEEETVPGLDAILVEMRDLRTDLKLKLDQMARLEKKLRLKLKDFT
ncbi:MAG: helix-turn-helix transcriptional regulator [Rhodobacteraceae bacterium]|nr:helix-turn-helix transcriptional regulator [Paracoccaceae bacterium]